MSKPLRCEFCQGTETSHGPACPLLHLYFEIVATGEPPPPPTWGVGYADRLAALSFHERRALMVNQWPVIVFDPSKEK